ncbi:MAG TPA: ketoacyl-ACP synthase III [Planctomycetes bacterium]|nr:ketoacyl-ACP synthase III [Planctomycetota bacterium]HIL38546.1 ketoacyl-ACP synthase III [Planctomycetota bacterium]
MTNLIAAGIAGTGLCLPERRVTNDELAKVIDTSDEWIIKRTGIRERRWVEDGVQCSDLATGAAREALANAGIKASDLDLIVVGTVSGDCVFPAVACQVQHNLGATCAAFDVNAACTGFLTAMQVGSTHISAGLAKSVLVIGSEALSRMVNKTDRGSAIIFGDGAGAAILQPFDVCGRGEILRSTLGADGSGHDLIALPMGGTRHFHNMDSYVKEDHFIQLKGREVYRFAVQKMAELIRWAMEGIDQDDLCCVIPHQVNQRIIEGALDRLDWDQSKVMVNIDRYGNTSAASVPIALHEALEQGRIQEGKYVVLVAFGAGLTWGGSLLRW